MGTRSPSSPYHDRRARIAKRQGNFLVYPPAGIAQGPLLPPQNRVMGNTNAPAVSAHARSGGQGQPRSNLSVLLEEQQETGRRGDSASAPSSVSRGSASSAPLSNVAREAASMAVGQKSVPNEADSASEPQRSAHFRVSSAPSYFGATRGPPPSINVPLPHAHSLTQPRARRSSCGDVPSAGGQGLSSSLGATVAWADKKVRRSISSKELGLSRSSATGSPHTLLLHQKEVLNATMQQRLMEMRESLNRPDYSPRSSSPGGTDTTSEGGSHSSHRGRHFTSNEKRNRRRAEHNKAVIADLCEVVTDLFVAESKLLTPSMYGVQTAEKRKEVLQSVEEFVSALPARYALGADTPSEVLVHMRLMAAVRSDPNKAVVHIVNREGDGEGSQHRLERLVTISCCDATGLLEYITKLLATGGSRVLDADVMLSTDGICLDRFVVEMSGRLRLDKLANCIEAFLANAKEEQEKEQPDSATSASEEAPESPVPKSPGAEPSGPIYVFPPPSHRLEASPKEIHDEIQGAVPLSQVLESNSSSALEPPVPMRITTSPMLRREHSMPNPPAQPLLSSPGRPQSTKGAQQQPLVVPSLDRRDRNNGSPGSGNAMTLRQRRPLVNREATNFSDLDLHGIAGHAAQPALDTPPASLQDRVIPLIPFEELMLIETLGMGRVSTIYRAAWQRAPVIDVNVEMVALKVATVNPETGDASHVDELRREADIAALLQNPNVCELVGVAADAECFCLAYEFCEGGSLLSLLSDNSRYYEYLPIALDIANGMAYLHSRDVIHRDLKPSNILLSRDHRAKIADFGMSVANTGQELTAETGTYRYMAPEVIRHESYSSNADVYSFGIVLWQLITREVPFATMTPIQAAFAVAEGRRPEIPASTPPRLREIITSCWDQDSQKRPSFTYIAMALADYARMAFSPANVGAQTLQIANEMLANVEGNSTVNVDFSTPVRSNSLGDLRRSWLMNNMTSGSYSSNVGLEI